MLGPQREAGAAGTGSGAAAGGAERRAGFRAASRACRLWSPAGLAQRDRNSRVRPGPGVGPGLGRGPGPPCRGAPSARGEPWAAGVPRVELGAGRVPGPVLFLRYPQGLSLPSRIPPVFPQFDLPAAPPVPRRRRGAGRTAAGGAGRGGGRANARCWPPPGPPPEQAAPGGPVRAKRECDRPAVPNGNGAASGRAARDEECTGTGRRGLCFKGPHVVPPEVAGPAAASAVVRVRLGHRRSPPGNRKAVGPGGCCNAVRLLAALLPGAPRPRRVGVGSCGGRLYLPIQPR